MTDRRTTTTHPHPHTQVALKAGVRAFWLDPRRPDDVIEHLLQISSPASAPASASSAAAGAAAAPR